ncbi:MAG: prolyl oligopeptidase family serine peptidase [Flammeovirgaceae bacterium]|nr:prolyl oligopeptidase family serine peptidase [Flammeovirgaceae bacterium]
MKKQLVLFPILFLLILGIFSLNAQPSTPQEYTLVVTGFDWGPHANKVILHSDTSLTEVQKEDFEVYVKRSSSKGEIPGRFSAGKRSIIHAFVSDDQGNMVKEGGYITLLLQVAPNDPMGSPMQYFRNGGSGGNIWIDYNLTVVNTKTQQLWNQEKNRIVPVVDEFDTSGTLTASNGIQLTYASYMPETTTAKIPLIIWLHGGGEGGTDPSVPIIANKAYNYASPEIQRFFGSAAVLAPQTPTRWMHGVSENTTRGQEDDIYHLAVMELVRRYVEDHPNIDKNRIYVGGCSNGGYMTLKLLIENPNYFAAGYISSLAFFNEFVSDKDLLKLKNIPLWMVHSNDDPTTVADVTATPLYHRLKKIGAKNVYYSLFDHVIDITGQYGGSSYLYNGHWSWVYLHDNQVFNDFDGTSVTVKGKPVSIMEWMAAQKK